MWDSECAYVCMCACIVIAGEIGFDEYVNKPRWAAMFGAGGF